MKLLFFDIEKASSKGGGKICEFGYVITNEEFNIIEEGNLLINPKLENSEWDWFVVRKILTFKKSEYEKHNYFSFYYKTINDIILSADHVFGHSINGDAKCLNDETIRYGLPSINFDFYDVKQIYSEYSNKFGETGLTEIIKGLNIVSEGAAHNAQVDAHNTMLALKKMINSMALTVDEMLFLCPKSKDKSFDFKVDSLEMSRLRKRENNTIGVKGEIKKFINEVKQNGKVGNALLLNKKVSISINYEEKHLKQMLYLIQRIVDEGGSYSMKASESDLFITYQIIKEDGSIKYCSKLKFVNEAIGDGKPIEIVSFDDFLKKLKLTYEILDNCY